MNARKRSRRPGYGLTEVIVVIGIITVLICLILPAIGRSRGAARRTACANNLRQQVLAMFNYEQQNNCLPSGVLNPDGPIHNRPEGYHHGWAIALLPFMEQSMLSLKIDPNLSVYETQNRAPGRINTLICPEDPYIHKPGTPPFATTYAACHHDVEAPIDVDNHGVFFLNSRVRHEDLLDGSSYTILIGEKPVLVGDLGWMSGTSATLRNTGTPLNDRSTFEPRKPGPNDEALFVGGYASYHDGGSNFTFGDGSIRFISQTVDRTVYEHLGHRADGEMISSSAFPGSLGAPLK